jgi:hypothetical protein
VKIVLLTDKAPVQSVDGVYSVLPEEFVKDWLKKEALLDLVAGCVLVSRGHADYATTQASRKARNPSDC